MTHATAINAAGQVGDGSILPLARGMHSFTGPNGVGMTDLGTLGELWGELTPATQQVFDRVVADGAWVPSKQCGMLNPHLAEADTRAAFAVRRAAISSTTA